jgi:hypothetical protein
VGKTRKGKGTKCIVLVDGQVVPLGMHLSAATPAEHSLAIATLEERVTERLPTRIIGDKSYDARAPRRPAGERSVPFTEAAAAAA